MSRVKRTVLVCDEGQHEVPALHTVLLTVDGRVRELDLCDEHVEPWLTLLHDGPNRPNRARVYTAREFKAMRG